MPPGDPPHDGGGQGGGRRRTDAGAGGLLRQDRGGPQPLGQGRDPVPVGQVLL